MKLPIHDNSDRGQVGIGTLIIFIALVLVAAVAAGVLVNTAGDLQSRASDTGEDAQAQVSNQIDVVSATGQDGDSSGDIDTITMVVKKSAGSDPIDLSAATIEYTSSSSSATLSYDASGVGANAFNTSIIDNGPQTVLENNGQRIEIEIDVDAVDGGLSEGSDAELQIVDQSGASTVYGINVPDVLTGEFTQV